MTFAKYDILSNIILNEDQEAESSNPSTQTTNPEQKGSGFVIEGLSAGKGETAKYRNAAWKKRRERYSGWIAQIIQHEMDHLEGVII